VRAVATPAALDSKASARSALATRPNLALAHAGGGFGTYRCWAVVPGGQPVGPFLACSEPWQLVIMAATALKNSQNRNGRDLLSQTQTKSVGTDELD
jgi:hypothetical protein